MLDIAFAKPALPKAGALVLPIAEGAALSGLAATLDAAMEGGLARALEAAGFKGKKGQSATLWAPHGGITKLVALGLGESPDAEKLGGSLVPLVSGEAAAMVAADGLSAEQAASLAMGAALRAYRFDRYRTTEKAEDKPKLAKLTIGTGEAAAAKTAFAPMKAVVEGVFLTRDLVSEPGNILHPAEFADRLKGLEKLGLGIEVLGPKEMKKLGFGALLGVAQGSINEPRMVVMKWNGSGKRKMDKPLCFIGKGVTFDTGGISIKPAGGMEDMKWDMAGAGTVAGLMAALAGRKAKADVIGIVGLVENMPGHNAQRPGDVVTSASGQTIEVINTDAEGRLVLADVIHYAIQKFDPAFMVDLATLTGAIIVALGHEHAGLFANDEELAARIIAAGNAVGEAAWRMPLGDAYDKQIKSDIADMKNVGGGRAGGSITAACFIQRFVQGKPWAHLDIAGTAWSSKDSPTIPKGATAYGVRMLDRLVAEHYEG
ncbi:leucyl aminopeptidase [Sediminicoccus rosea]|uniref:Probable cytosol aminopeptidase n=1 Tax=Sediminicoccus rosea TaxID=1225128 RepID=A0ABZ0PH48_9PROT|nr:leucyl aminopeptidase [Sediminicoccus rosea]WPB84668.1 leucyl aminopeptidase [Sediminicoccus rosea]